MQWRKNSIYLFIYFLQFWNSKPLTLCFYSLWSMQAIPMPVSEEALAFPIFLLCSSCAFGLEILFPTISLSLSLCFSQILFILHDQWLLTYHKAFPELFPKRPHGSDPATQGRVLCREYLCVFYLHQHIKQEVKDQLLLPLCASKLLTWCHRHHSHQFL